MQSRIKQSKRYSPTAKKRGAFVVDTFRSKIDTVPLFLFVYLKATDIM